MNDTTNFRVTDPTAELAIQAMEIQALNFAYRFTKDMRVRLAYMSRTREMSESLRAAYQSGEISAQKAAETANEMRNEIMEYARSRSSDVGRAKAKALKARGLDLKAVLNKYAKRKFSTDFDALSESQKSDVYLQVVDSAGRANPNVNLRIRRLGAASRGLWVLTAVIAIYDISTAANKAKQAGREAANVGGGMLGGEAGGAVAGIWFGPIGVIVGVILGGALGSTMADQVYVEAAGPDGAYARRFIPRFTSVFGVDEQGMANALYTENTYNVDRVFLVFVQLSDKYSTSADDVARLYVDQVRRTKGATEQALRLNVGLRNLLIALMVDGWTTAKEQRDISYLENL